MDFLVIDPLALAPALVVAALDRVVVLGRVLRLDSGVRQDPVSRDNFHHARVPAILRSVQCKKKILPPM